MALLILCSVLLLLYLWQAFKVQTSKVGAFAVKLRPLIKQVSFFRQGDLQLLHITGCAYVACGLSTTLYSLFDAPWYGVRDVLAFQLPNILRKLSFQLPFVVKRISMLVKPTFKVVSCGTYVDLFLRAAFYRSFVYHIFGEARSIQRACAIPLAVTLFSAVVVGLALSLARIRLLCDAIILLAFGMQQ